MAAMMELDPIFVKALKLLHSKAKDSAAQLKQMVDDSIAQKKGRVSRDNSPKPSLVTTKSYVSSKPDFDEIRKRETEKRNFEKVNKDLSDLVQPPEPKKPKLEPKPIPEVKKEDHKTKASKDKEVVVKERFEEKYEKKIKTESVKSEPKPERKRIIVPEDDSTSSDDLGMDADDFAVDMGIACVVCRQFDSTASNQLVECQECHSLYHQQCHKPAVSSQDVNDPRFVWYCSKCQKIMKKIVTTKPQKTKPATPSSNSAGSFLFPKDSSTTKSTSSLSSKPSPTETPFQAFKRLADAKTAGPGGSSGGSKPFIGLAGMAANLSGKTSESSKTVKISETKTSKSFDSLKFSSKSSDSLKTKSSETTKSKTSSTSGAGKSSSSIGLAKLASSVSGSTTTTSSTTKSGSTSSSSGKTSSSQLSRSNSGGTSHAMAAEKKLQMMKKKAAAKLQERRK